MKTLSLILGRILFGIPILLFGLFHFFYGTQMAEMALAGWPFAIVFVYISGLGLLLAGISIIIQRYTHIACWLLALELFIIILAVQLPALAYASEGSMQALIGQLLNTITMIGGALVIASTYTGKEK